MRVFLEALSCSEWTCVLGGGKVEMSEGWWGNEAANEGPLKPKNTD